MLPPKPAKESRIEDLEHMLNSPAIEEHTAMLTGPRPLLSFDEETVVFDEFNGPQGLWTKRVSWLRDSSAGLMDPH